LFRPPQTCYFAPKICSSLPELCGIDCSHHAGSAAGSASGSSPLGTASHLPRLEDLNGLDVRVLAPAASTPFGQRKASRPFGAAEGRHALGPELAGRVCGEVDHHAMAVEAAHAGAVVRLAVLVDSLELDAHAAP